MLSIRFSRTGKKAQPSFRIIVQEKTLSPKRDALEILGHYMPARQPKVVKLEKEKILDWIKKGARPSDSVASLLKKEGFTDMDRYMAPRDKKLKKKGEEAKA